ncbi:MAG: hypothetical protein ACI8TP_001179 [Acidimicrobiales bacterium]|jgi:uncharacterized protein (DUF1501 family)
MTRFSALDPTTGDVVDALSTPAPRDPASLKRRRFLQTAGAATALSMMPTWLADQAAAAVPLGPSDGVLVVITMVGGNDGLNTVVPIADGTYYGQRGNLAIPASSTLPLSPHRGLHPSLVTLKAHWEQGNVAIIEGVGHPSPDLSHFTSMGRIMHGSSAAGSATSGWLGRYVDGLPGGDDPFHAVAIGRNVPLVMRGQQRQALALPSYQGGLFEADTEPWSQRQYAALHTIGASAGSTGLGPWGDALAANGSEALLVAGRLGDAYSGELPGGELSTKLTLAARLINANLGVRVFHVMFGDFDSHANQPRMHNERMAEFETGLAAFYQTLSPAFAGRTMVLAASEFGRRIKPNNSAGTDHGAANTWLAVGAGVKGGFYGGIPSLANPDNRGNIRTAVDYRNVYSNVLDSWLKADGSGIVGQSFGDLGFLSGPFATPGANGSTPSTIATQRLQLSRLYLAYFLRLPDYSGLTYWQREMSGGRSLAHVSEAFAKAPEFASRYGSLDDRGFVQLVYRNVLGRDPDSAGLSYWAGRLATGDSRGRVMIGFSESQEFIDGTRVRINQAESNGPVARLYRAYFLREADEEGLHYWLATGLPLQQISSSFADTPEFRERYGILNDDAFVRLVYQNVMQRPPDSDGLGYWKTQLRSGLTRGSLMVNFSESDEFVSRSGS